MKLEKQLLVKEILATGRYSIRDGQIYNRNKVLKGNTLSTGYTQVKLFNGRRGKEGKSILTYLHIIIYINTHGTYPEHLEIDHINNNVSDNRIENLQAITASENTRKRTKREQPEFRTIRSNEIEEIRWLMAEGLSQTQIANKLNLNRASVCVTINKIKAGHKLKYEGKK